MVYKDFGFLDNTFSIIIVEIKKSRLTLIIFLLLIIPIIIIGIADYYFSRSELSALALKNVGQVSDSKKEQLLLKLKIIRQISANLLNEGVNRCEKESGKFYKQCYKHELNDLLNVDGAIAAMIFDEKNTELFGVQKDQVLFSKFEKIKSGQLAVFSNFDTSKATQFYIEINLSFSRRAIVVYKASTIQEIFDKPTSLGETGEIFLADTNGLFLTKPRYQLLQGYNSHPISALPMKNCLQGENNEILAPDYRGVAVIHGYRFIPEVGGGCIMAQISQVEAFAPLQRLLIKSILIPILLIVVLLYFMQKLSGEIYFQLIYPQAREKNSVNIEKNWSEFILASIDDAIVEFDVDGKINEANRKMLSMFGYEKKELIGKEIKSVFSESESDSNYFKSFLDKCLEMHEDRLIDSSPIELIGKTKNESHIPVNILLKELIKDQEIVFVAIIKDMAKQKELEKKLEEEKAIAIQASKFVAIGQLAGSIAHEINSPLSAMLISAESLDLELNNEAIDMTKVKKHLAMTIRIIDKIKKLINSVKKMGRANTNEVKNTVNIKEIIDDIRIISDAIIRSTGIEFSCIFEHTNISPLIKANQIQIEQVLMNVISNSIDAISESESRWIRMEVTSVERNVRIRITDSGLGIPENISNKLFSTFFTTKDPGKGAGIGLVICQRIIAEHGGTIGLDRNYNNTSFVIELPIVENEIANTTS